MTPAAAPADAIQRSFPAFHAHPEVVAVLGGVALAYLWALRRFGPDRVGPGEAVASLRQRAQFLGGVAVLFVFAQWPVHDLSERYSFGVHMVEHAAFSFLAPPLLVLGTPAWLKRMVLVETRAYPVVRRLTRPITAGLLFNAWVVFTHIPVVVDTVTPNEWLHFSAHVGLVATALLMWFPLCNDLPEFTRMGYLGKSLYMFLQSVVPVVPAAFYTFAETTLNAFYARRPLAIGLDPLDDQLIAGLVMSVGETVIFWAVIVGIFVRWYGEIERGRRRDLQAWKVGHDVDRALTPSGS